MDPNVTVVLAPEAKLPVQLKVEFAPPSTLERIAMDVIVELPKLVSVTCGEIPPAQPVPVGLRIAVIPASRVSTGMHPSEDNKVVRCVSSVVRMRSF